MKRRHCLGFFMAVAFTTSRAYTAPNHDHTYRLLDRNAHQISGTLYSELDYLDAGIYIAKKGKSPRQAINRDEAPISIPLPADCKLERIILKQQNMWRHTYCANLVRLQTISIGKRCSPLLCFAKHTMPWQNSGPSELTRNICHS